MRKIKRPIEYRTQNKHLCEIAIQQDEKSEDIGLLGSTFGSIV